MSVTIVSADRQALREWEEAERHAEACRQDWLRVLAAQPDDFIFMGGPIGVVQAAINYAEAANAAHLKREAYEAMILEEMAKEHDTPAAGLERLLSGPFSAALGKEDE